MHDTYCMGIQQLMGECKQLGGGGLADMWGLQICRWHMLVSDELPSRYIRQLGRRHAALRLGEVARVKGGGRCARSCTNSVPPRGRE